MRKLAFGVAALAATFAVAAHAVAASTVVVYPLHEDGWTAQHGTCGVGTTGSQAFVTGPGTPPAGTGSREFRIGTDGDSFEAYRQSGYGGTLLTNLTALSYSTYVTQYGSGGQAAYLILNISYTSGLTVDDQLFFEPVYQTGAYTGDTVPNQGAPTLHTWQSWDALHGGWWSGNDNSGGPPLHTLANYAAAHPGARIVNTTPATGGVRIAAGCGGAAWLNFIGNADAFTIGVGGTSTTYDFEAKAPVVGPPTTVDQCKHDGWRQFNHPAFKSQGACIEYVHDHSGHNDDGGDHGGGHDGGHGD